MIAGIIACFIIGISKFALLPPLRRRLDLARHFF